jgi:hypothetical protein
MNNLINNTYNYIKNYSLGTNKCSTKSNILDPVSTVIRISLLHYKPKGTKISICNNSIKYQEPSFIQGAIRWLNGDNRNDIHNLKYPFSLFVKWYCNEINDIHQLSEKDMNFLLEVCNVGLYALKNNYENNGDIICDSLQHYSDILSSNVSLNNREENEIYLNIKEMWSFNEIHIICNLMREVELYKSEETHFNSYIGSIEKILIAKDNHIHKFINDVLYT